MPEFAELISQAMTLPADERANLAHQLILSLEKERPESKENLEDILVARQKRVEDGDFQAYDATETLDRIKSSLDRNKQQ